ncbi:hypothetical protein RHMOL_Rhmol06G0000100 [Rhododendron molle]|uniref:Uncharacterized protein n=1 Tax=Rhododendron molle TaxID=49168 RepID=A0ACC0N6Y0_RHOML|nr:hypothetical protein RHMOL_Rhmol06G0000100 [Rhododendron molle]
MILKHTKKNLVFGPAGLKKSGGNLGARLRCKPSTKEYSDKSQNDLPSINRSGIAENAYVTQLEAAVDKEWKKIKQHVDAIRSMLGSMGDGQISISAYDTAWVALVEDIKGSGTPQFPSCLEWIASNQLQDGSWGDSSIFEAHDRIINTLGCVIALRSWNVHPDKSEKGLTFIKENLNKLEDEDAEHMPIGFEIAFPSLIETARKLDIQVPDDSPVLQEIYARKNLKLTRIPRDVMHKVPTTLLHSLEGLHAHGLEWEKLLKLQCQDGSFLFSPSSTAFALMETKDVNCLRYLTRVVETFNGGVPNVYPVDLFERMWAVDRLERLGISRYFKSVIKECVDYIHRYWTEEGICWARNSLVHDIDDTSMGFRLLRLHGYSVSADVFGHFRKGDEFFCFAGQSTQAVTGIYNLYRASHISFPEEKILDDANEFSSKFLREKRACNELLDKWIVTKDLPGEVGYALDVPWYASLPRVEARFYLEHYGGVDDVWIGKTLYRMPYVNNTTYLELAKFDYNKCQALHQQEWYNIQMYKKATGYGLLRTLIRSINQLSLNTLEEHGRDIHHNLLQAWESWMKNWEGGGDMYEEEAKLLIHDDKDSCNMTVQIKSDMQELVQLVLCSSPNDIDPETKQIFLGVAKSYYYNAHCTRGTIHFHIAKVLFERVI